MLAQRSNNSNMVAADQDNRSHRLPKLDKEASNWKAFIFKLRSALRARKLRNAFKVNIPNGNDDNDVIDVNVLDSFKHAGSVY